jgi:hypothetical protein
VLISNGTDTARPSRFGHARLSRRRKNHAQPAGTRRGLPSWVKALKWFSWDCAPFGSPRRHVKAARRHQESEVAYALFRVAIHAPVPAGDGSCAAEN